MRKSTVRKRARVAKARLRVLKQAKAAGFITNEQAKKVGGWDQAFYHLNKLAQAGYLRREKYNTWVPAKRGPLPSQLTV